MTNSVRIQQAPILTLNAGIHTSSNSITSSSSHRRTRTSNRIMVRERSTNGGMGIIGTKPTLVEVGTKLRFLIMDAPRQANLHLYIREMRKNSVTDLVRVCEPTYQTGELTTAGIASHNMEYADGHSPPQEVIDQWLRVVDKALYDGNASSSGPSSEMTRPCVAVHCVAGLGRAPVMVAIALIEFDNMDPVDAVSLIRKHRRGAINEKQLLYLEGYKKKHRKRNTAESGCCVIS